MDNEELSMVLSKQDNVFEPAFLEKIERLVLEESLEEYAQGIIHDGILFEDSLRLGYMPTPAFVIAWKYVEDRLDIGLEGFVKMTKPLPKLPRPFSKILDDNATKGYDLNILPCLSCQHGYAFNTSPVLGSCLKYIKGKPKEVMEGKEHCPLYRELTSTIKKLKK